MKISVTTPIDLALDRTKQILFKPFQAGKWFTLGFCAFLAYLGEGHGGINCNFPVGSGGGGGGGRGGPPATMPTTFPSIETWWTMNRYWVIPVVAAAVIAIIALMALITWLKCRGNFMFLDGVIRNCGAVVEPWHRFRKLANSLFGFYLLFDLVAIVGLMMICGIGLAFAWPAILAGRFSACGVIGIIVGVALLLLASLVMFVIALLMKDFVVPAMYLRNERIMTAWGIVRREILAGHVGVIVLFYLMKLVFSIAIGVIALLATCLTCCCAALPYLGAVVLLPLTVFMRAYTLHFLEQFGPQWRFFVHDGPRCVRCGYNLTGNVSGICPECGTPVVLIPSAPPTMPQGPPMQ